MKEALIFNIIVLFDGADVIFSEMIDEWNLDFLYALNQKILNCRISKNIGVFYTVLNSIFLKFILKSLCKNKHHSR